MGIDQLKNKIKEGYDKTCKQIISHAKEEARNIQSEYTKRVKELEERSLSRLSQDLNLLQVKTLARTRISLQGSYLKKREEIIQHVINDALVHLRADQNYQQFMLRIAKSARSYSGKIYCADMDLKLVRTLFPKAAVETKEMLGGLIFEDDHTRDESIERYLEQRKDAIRSKIAQLLEGV